MSVGQSNGHSETVFKNLSKNCRDLLRSQKNRSIFAAQQRNICVFSDAEHNICVILDSPVDFPRDNPQQIQTYTVTVTI